MALNIPEVSYEELVEIDQYIRIVESDTTGYPHILVVVPNSSSFAEFFGDYRSYVGWTGATSSVNWNWETNAMGEPFIDNFAMLSAVTPFQNPAVQFGLIVHELSHASFTNHGNGSSLGDANFWERIANAAYNHNCGINIYCLDLENIIYDTP